MVCDPLIHSVMPDRMVPMPSVTMNALILKTTTKNPLMKPMATPSARAITIVSPMGTPC